MKLEAHQIKGENRNISFLPKQERNKYLSFSLFFIAVKVKGLANILRGNTMQKKSLNRHVLNQSKPHHSSIMSL